MTNHLMTEIMIVDVDVVIFNTIDVEKTISRPRVNKYTCFGMLVDSLEGKQTTVFHSTDIKFC